MKKFLNIVIWLLVLIVIILLLGKCGYPTFKMGWQKPRSEVADGFAISHANQDTIKAIGRVLQGREPQQPQRIYYGGGTIYRDTVVREIPASRQPAEPAYYSAPNQSTDQPQSHRTTPQTETIVSGSATPGPEDLLFCIDLEPTKTSDASKKFLFWELVNNEGYSISNVIPNFTGRSANMLLAPGGSVNGISYDGSMLRMSVAFVGSSYAKIMGVPMPDNFRPALRSNKSGWSSRLMTRSGDYFVYRF